MLSKTNLITVLIFVICSFYSSALFAQTPGYVFIGDSIYTEGYIHFNTSRPDKVEYRQTKNADPKLYTAEQLTEFGYHDSTKYISEMVPYEGKLQKLFTKQLSTGKLKLYMLPDGDAFYIKKEELIQLNKDNLEVELRPFTENCPTILGQLKRVKLSEVALTYFGQSINKGKCTTIPFTSYGVAGAVNRTALQLSKTAFPANTYGDFEMVSNNTSIGIFGETPSWLVQNLNLSGQFTYNKMQFSQAHSKTIHEQDIRLNMDLLRFNVQPKYYLHVRRFSFFAEAGTELLYLINQSGKLLQATRVDMGNGQIKVQLAYTDDFLDSPTVQYGIIGGGGLMYYYASTHYISLSLNTSHSFNKDQTINNFSTTLRINL